MKEKLDRLDFIKDNKKVYFPDKAKKIKADKLEKAYFIISKLKMENIRLTFENDTLRKTISKYEEG